MRQQRSEVTSALPQHLPNPPSNPPNKKHKEAHQVICALVHVSLISRSHPRMNNSLIKFLIGCECEFKPVRSGGGGGRVREERKKR